MLHLPSPIVQLNATDPCVVLKRARVTSQVASKAYQAVRSRVRSSLRLSLSWLDKWCLMLVWCSPERAPPFRAMNHNDLRLVIFIFVRALARDHPPPPFDRRQRLCPPERSLRFTDFLILHVGRNGLLDLLGLLPHVLALVDAQALDCPAHPAHLRRKRDARESVQADGPRGFH